MEGATLIPVFWLRVIGPLQVFEPLRLSKAMTLLLLIKSDSLLMKMPPSSASFASLLTEVAPSGVPSAVGLAAINVPPLTDALPRNVLLPLKRIWPEPFLLMPVGIKRGSSPKTISGAGMFSSGPDANGAKGA